MSAEYSNQKVREDNFEIQALTKLNTDDIERLCKTHETLKYIPVADCTSLLSEATQLLMGSAGKDTSALTCGIEADMVRAIVCALLRVPEQHVNLLNSLNLKQRTTEEAKAFEVAQTAAARISKKLTKSNGTAANYEEYAALISKAADPKFTQQLLLSAKLEDMPVQTPSGSELPIITPPPKTLISKTSVLVRLKILCVDEGNSVASVQVQKEDGDVEQPALAGMIGKTLPMEFSAKRIAMRNMLIGMQLLKKSISCKVSVVRALRTSDAKHSTLRLIKCQSTDLEQQEVRAELAQIDLDFGSIDAQNPLVE